MKHLAVLPQIDSPLVLPQSWGGAVLIANELALDRVRSRWAAEKCVRAERTLARLGEDAVGVMTELALEPYESRAHVLAMALCRMGGRTAQAATARIAVNPQAGLMARAVCTVRVCSSERLAPRALLLQTLWVALATHNAVCSLWPSASPDDRLRLARMKRWADRLGALSAVEFAADLLRRTKDPQSADGQLLQTVAGDRNPASGIWREHAPRVLALAERQGLGKRGGGGGSFVDAWGELCRPQPAPAGCGSLAGVLAATSEDYARLVRGAVAPRQAFADLVEARFWTDGASLHVQTGGVRFTYVRDAATRRWAASAASCRCTTGSDVEWDDTPVVLQRLAAWARAHAKPKAARAPAAEGSRPKQTAKPR